MVLFLAPCLTKMLSRPSRLTRKLHQFLKFQRLLPQLQSQLPLTQRKLLRLPLSREVLQRLKLVLPLQLLLIRKRMQVLSQTKMNSRRFKLLKLLDLQRKLLRELLERLIRRKSTRLPLRRLLLTEKPELRPRELELPLGKRDNCTESQPKKIT